METIIPKEQLLREILESLGEWIPDFDPQSVITSLAIIEFANRCLAAYEAHFSRYDLSQGRFAILMFLFHYPEKSLTPAALAELTGVRRATMTGLLEVLERGKWIRRRPNPSDGRSREIQLTKSGRERLKELLPGHFALTAKSLEGLGRKEHAALMELMQKFGQHVETMTPSEASKTQVG